MEDMAKPLCDLGFITSSRIIFDATGTFTPFGMHDTKNIIEAFNPETSKKIFFPEYNISTRQLYQFDDKPIDIIAPTDPPKKPNHGLFYMLLPSVLSIGVLLLVRIILMSMGSGGSGIAMIILSVAMGLTAVITTTLSWKRQKKEYADGLRDWRTQYENYISNLFDLVKKRQIRDRNKLDELYPDMLSLINQNDRGIYSLNENIYSRSVMDEDFLSFRIGLSDDVPSKFQVRGERKDTIFSEAFFKFDQNGNGEERIHIALKEELDKQGYNGQYENLCELPGIVSNKYKNLKNAPLLYSLKDKGALGVVDYNVGGAVSKSAYFISRMIFELCYYHSPEDLQFVMFYNNEKNWNNIENLISRYKFMPHFRGLFPDKSQFVFDTESANLVMSSLLKIVGERDSKSEGNVARKTPHIVVIVFDEHGLKEHALAEYLPKAPEAGKDFVNKLGLTFVFATKYKEYLPAYCDDVINFDGSQMTLTPRNNVLDRKVFRYSVWMNSGNQMNFYVSYIKDVTRALRFFSSVYYAQIAQNGKVPSAVSMFDVVNTEHVGLDSLIKSNWGIGGKRALPGVTESLKVPIGRTETGLAYLDLHEKFDGPHMLVAGTTGSGKTETIISYLLGLCMQYRPDELNMMLVDMKGGGFTKRIGHLPHVVGSVTDVDGDENGTGAEYMLGRFLNAMKSEVKRRKMLFNRLHVDSIDAYIRACNNIDAHIAKKQIEKSEADEIKEIISKEHLSHLILVVDEFTELKRFTSENSDIDFMGEITTIARVGRSLGFHIILISQNIEGAITDDIRVNSNARLCLKVATRQASKDMIGTELAASPYMPGNGRAYLLVGTGSKFDYFQSAYSGASEEESIPIEITLASKYGAYSSFYRSDKDNMQYLKKIDQLKKSGKLKSQLEVIAESICSIYNDNKGVILEPHIIFRSPLSTRIAWDSDKESVIDMSKRKSVI